MIIDLILSRKENFEFDGCETYDAHEFYRDCLEYEQIVGFKPTITRAMEYGTEQDVKNALCDYIIEQEYNPDICDFINNVDWL